MKYQTFLISIFTSAFLCACVNVDEQTSEKPSVYWKAPTDAIPEKPIVVENIKTDKILTENSSENNSQKNAQQQKFVRSTDKIEAGVALNLPDLIDIALENSPSTRIYWFQAKSYAASVGKANSAYYPQVSVSANVYRSRVKPSLAYGGAFANVGKYYETGFGPSAEINWLLCDFGKRSANVESARQALYAANFEYNQAIQDVVLNVNLAFCNFVEANGNVEAAKLNIQDAQTAYKSAQERLNSGVGNKPDMLNSLANLRNAEFALQKALASVETARANLANVLGIKVSDKLNIDVSVTSYALPPTASQKIDDLVAQAMRSRQDLLASYAQLKKAEFDVKAAKRDFLPQISASASASLTDYSRSGRNTQSELQAGLGISWSIFEGFTRKYELISAKMQERATAQTLKQNQIKIMSDIWSAYYLYRSAQKQVASARAAVDANMEAYQATKVGYENGVNSINDFLNAQTRLASARQQQVSAESTQASAIARLAHATGALSVNSEQLGILPEIKK